MQSSHISMDDFANDSQLLGRIINLLHHVAIGVKRWWWNILGVGVFFLASLFLWVFFRVFRYKISNAKIVYLDLTPKNYVQTRKNYDKLNSSIESLRKIQKISSDGVPFYLRFLIKEIKATIGLMEKEHSKIEDYLGSLDKIPNNESPTIFRVVPERELWQGKINSYSYKV